jgi:glutathione S-transferase
MEWLLDHRRWLAGDRMTMADFAAAAHISCLDYISDVDWTSSPPVKDWYDAEIAPAFRSILSDHVPGFRAAAPLREPRLLTGLKRG